MSNKRIERIKTITNYHKSRGLAKPEHPLISLIDYEAIKHSPENNDVNWVQDFYSVSLKRNFDAKIKYGQSEYDFDEGLLFFLAPGQVFSIEVSKNRNLKRSGWILLIHPDFLWKSSLGKTIKKYDYFDYSVNEALFLSSKEEKIVTDILKSIRHEYQSNIDSFSQDLIIAQLELLFTYSERFYNRQFLNRKITNHKILTQLEDLLSDYFNDEDLSRKGLPTVQYVAEKLNISPNYLSNLLKVLSGQSTQQHIHEKFIEKAKEKLSITELSVGEIAYSLGFEHTQSFSRLFKLRSKLSPQEFRASFN